MRPLLIAGADIDTEQPQQLTPATHQRPVQRSTRTAGTRRTATTLDSAPGSGPLRAVEAAPMLDSSRHAVPGIGRPVC